MTAAVMLIGIVLLIVIHEGGHFVAAKSFDMKVTEAFFGFGPKLWSTQRGETEYGVKAIPFGGYVRIIGMNPLEEIEPGDADRTYRAAPFWQKSIVVLAGVASHLVMAFLLFLVVFGVWGERAQDEEGQLIPTLALSLVAQTTPDGDRAPALIAGFEAGDVLTSFEGAPVGSWQGFVDLVQDNGGNTVMVGYDREGVAAESPVALATIESPLIVDGEAVTDDQGNTVTQRVGYFGAAPEVERVDAGLLSSAGAAIGSVWSALDNSVRGLWALIVGFPELLLSVFSGDDEVLQEVRPISPIGLVRLAGPLESTLALLALVNVFVAVINVIPLYPLDGGHFAVATYEKITGREPDVRKLTPIAAVVIVFLITLGLVGVYLDIFRPLQM